MKTSRKLKYCSICHKLIKDFSRRRYCSDECLDIGTKKLNKKRNRGSIKAWKVCWHCYQLFFDIESKKYCREECRKESNKEHLRTWKMKNAGRFKRLQKEWRLRNEII